MQNSNKQIAKNTLIVYFRTIITAIIGLFSSRFVLQALGASDYGLYNIVGGVIAMFAFISTSLSISTTRFLNFEMGKPNGNLNKIFNINNVLHICIALIVFILAETIGLFYIQNYLNVAIEKKSDAFFIYQISTITVCLGIIGIPFQSLFVAKEKFRTIAFIDIISSIIKLILILTLFVYNGNTLRFYAIFMSLITLCTFSFYFFCSYKYWPSIVKWKFVPYFSEYKPILSFNNYNMLDAASLLGRSQGSNILINLFFGTLANAAYAISNTVLSYVNIFIGNFDTAAGPQITQNVSAGNKERYLFLARFTCRSCILFMMAIYFPLATDIDFILHLWLGENVPEGTSIFCEYTLLIAVISSTAAGFGHLVNAFGKIKWFRICKFILYVGCLPIGYFLFKFGYPPYTIVILLPIADAIYRIIQFTLMKIMYNFEVIPFIQEAYIRPAIVFLVCSVLMFFYKKINLEGICPHLFGMIGIFTLYSTIAITIGLKKGELKKIIQHIRTR